MFNENLICRKHQILEIKAGLDANRGTSAHSGSFGATLSMRSHVAEIHFDSPQKKYIDSRCDTSSKL